MRYDNAADVESVIGTNHISNGTVVPINTIVVALIPLFVMSTGELVSWETLKGWRAIAFLIAGGLWVVDTGVNLLELGTDISVPGVVFLVFILSSLLFTLLGVFGLYPEMADRGSLTARIGALFVGLAGLLIIVVLTWGIIASLLNQPLPAGALAAVIVLAVVFGLFLFGIATVRSTDHSRAVGLLLLALVATWVVWFAGIAGFLGGNPEWSSAAFGVVLSGVTLSIGILLRMKDQPTNRAVLKTEPTTR